MIALEDLSPYRAVRFGQLFELLLHSVCQFLRASFRELHPNGTVESASSSSDLRCRFVSVESRPLWAESCHGGAYPILALSSDFLLSLSAWTIAGCDQRGARRSRSASIPPAPAQPWFLTEKPTLNMLSVLLFRQPLECDCRYDRNHQHSHPHPCVSASQL